MNVYLFTLKHRPRSHLHSVRSRARRYTFLDLNEIYKIYSLCKYVFRNLVLLCVTLKKKKKEACCRGKNLFPFKCKYTFVISLLRSGVKRGWKGTELVSPQFQYDSNGFRDVMRKETLRVYI